LMRRGQPVRLTSRRLADLADAVVAASPRTSILLTNLAIADLRALAPRLPRKARLLGFRRESAFGCSSELRLQRPQSSGGRRTQHPWACQQRRLSSCRRPVAPGAADAMDEYPTRRKRHWCTLAVGRGLLARGRGSCEANSEICGCTSACVRRRRRRQAIVRVGGPSPTDLNQKMRRNDKEGDGGMTQSSQPVWVLQ
jgi:hypothetical protein